MSLFSSFVAAVLLTDAASVAYAAITVDGNGGVSHSAGFVDREATAATPLVSSSSSSSSSSSTASNSHSSSPSAMSWSTTTFCGHHSHDRCVAFYVVGFGGLFLVACVLCVGWIVRWRWCSSQGLSGWRRADVMPTAGYGDEEESGYVTERAGLLVHADDDSHSDREESTPESAHGGVADRVARCVRRLNLHGTRLWTFLRLSPAGLFYGASHSTSPPQSPPPAPPPSASAAGSHRRGLLDEADVTSSDGTISHDASWDLQRTDRAASVPSSAGRPFLRGVISVATTTADSSESGNESGRHSDDGTEVLHDGSGHRPFLCDRECLIVEVAENECGVRRSAVVVLPPSSPITPHILPQLVHYNSSSAREEDGGDEDDVGGFADTTDSDSQQMGDAAGAAERAMRLSTSSMTASANSSGHSPLFLRVESAGSVSHGESSEHDGAAHSSTSPLRFPHVETAIFDVSMHGGVAVSGAGAAAAAATHIVTADPSVVNALFEPDHFPQASLHSGSEAPISSAASHVSLVDCCYTPPPMTSGTATPGSARGSGPCKPLSCAAATATVLPVSNSLSDGLDMEGEAVVDDFESAQMSRSYVPATQQQQHHLQQQQQQPQQPQRVAVVVVEPPQPEKMHKSSRRTRSDSYYSEPWQPVLVQRPPSQLADAAAATVLPIDVVPVFPTVPTRTAEATLRNTVPARPQQPQPQQSPRCPLHTDLCGDLEDELDDLMLEDDASAQSNRTGESGHIFSGSSTSTSRTVTPATETDPESVVGTPTMFCATAMANGGRSCYPGFLTVSPPASASIPLHPESPPVAIFARTVGAGGNFFARDSGMRGGCGNTPPWSSCSVGRGPLHLSLEERTLLMKSRKWLFPLIDGADEIETSVVGEGEQAGDENHEPAAVSEEV